VMMRSDTCLVSAFRRFASKIIRKIPTIRPIVAVNMYVGMNAGPNVAPP
jgi:hypothetical protein